MPCHLMPCPTRSQRYMLKSSLVQYSGTPFPSTCGPLDLANANTRHHYHHFSSVRILLPYRSRRRRLHPSLFLHDSALSYMTVIPSRPSSSEYRHIVVALTVLPLPSSHPIPEAQPRPRHLAAVGQSREQLHALGLRRQTASSLCAYLSQSLNIFNWHPYYFRGPS